ncbi:hypothetical protein [Bradyrhizobium sp. SYSU BS000235]|uniref:hypothetical protein n=1 Tax=Bradyrhizobium sp. SYSU BS000235 TaxID=3411332 RepID=UPI003C73EDC2
MVSLHDRSLRLAPQWTYIGTNAAGVGAIVHVGIITGRDASGRWVVLIGNDGIWGRYRPAVKGGGAGAREQE